MFRFLIALLLAASLAHAQLITVECSDGQAQFEAADLKTSKCLRITQDTTITRVLNYVPGNSALINDASLKLNQIDSRSLKLFIALSKLEDAKIFAFIDALSPDEFRLFDYHAKYLRVYHELDVLFKYKFLKEYSLNGASKEIGNFVYAKFFPFKFVTDAQKGTAQWQYSNLFNKYFPELNMFQFSQSLIADDYRAFFVLIDFYQQTMQKPLKLSTSNLQNVFNSFDLVIQNGLLNKQLVVLQ